LLHKEINDLHHSSLQIILQSDYCHPKIGIRARVNGLRRASALHEAPVHLAVQIHQNFLGCYEPQQREKYGVYATSDGLNMLL
jgi:hypothetical protein